MNDTVTLIVYGTLLSGECNSFYCKNALSVTPCSIRGTLYDTGLGYPAFVPGGDYCVKAEAVVIPAEDWPAVDELEDYPVEYDRMIISAALDGGGEVRGWVYVMNTLPEKSAVITSGDWKKH